MIKETIDDICEQYKDNINTNLNNFKTLMLYHILNKPYFKDQYNYLSLYEKSNNEFIISVNQESNKRMSFSYNFKKTETIFPINSTQKLYKKEQSYLEKILKKSLKLNSFKDFINHPFSHDELKLIKSIAINNKEDLISNVLSLPRDNDNKIDSQHLELSANKYFRNKSNILSHMNPDDKGNLTQEHIIDLLEIDKLSYLSTHLDSMSTIKFIEKFTKDDWFKNNTYLGIFSSTSNYNEAFINAVDAFSFKEMKEIFFQEYNKIYGHDTIEDKINKIKDSFNFIEAKIIEKFPELNSEFKNLDVFIINSKEHTDKYDLNSFINFNCEVVDISNRFDSLRMIEPSSSSYSLHQTVYIDENIEPVIDPYHFNIALIAKDSINTYGFIQGECNMENKSHNILYINEFSISELIDKSQIKEIIEPLFVYCKENKLVLDIESVRHDYDSKFNQLVDKELRELVKSYQKDVLIAFNSKDYELFNGMPENIETQYNMLIKDKKFNYDDGLKVAKHLREFYSQNNNCTTDDLVSEFNNIYKNSNNLKNSYKV